ncbi:calcium/sodium antiporter [Mergibacter septicus]|uniref:calcium/sodium antiporter n=1 Tax=Mergibacter septicus TaxID=221402 RepID=UPI0011792F43|nr:calcium/sodium antiporter [Mergibacter septicus]AWX13508.1 calcium/sodium antiporter [Mergibacter septicus]
MLLPILAVVSGLILLVWSADRFVDGAATTAYHFNLSPLLIGMLIVGFGTSSPEIVVSSLSALQGASNLALGNAYGSNITNIGLILGITALITPIVVQPNIIKKELPLLTFVTLITLIILYSGKITRIDSAILLAIFAIFIFLSIRQNRQNTTEITETVQTPSQPLSRAIFWLITGLILLITSSQALVWGAIEIARYFNISEMVIGLTVIAIGTSLPELASSIIAARKKQHDIVLGNIIGSNLFNTLAVVGLAGIIRPFNVPTEAFYRDGIIMLGLTLALFCSAIHYRIGRFFGLCLCLTYLAYTLLLAYQTF